ncbi:LytTR family DNA-binding domain-containing protein [Lactiplantibacillus sp. WILCCON 0030]|uniref:LytTR family DNA-binding domain-containing protein n=1 Tax=Lactiplantibacillus brownii TaxID=3069269 RepID=A0ABU1A7B7_9LACO|nr:LytTR family DNA-binding domain-containing protein [Lactiplantibacillus brownii]MDQ7936766.1 LytTR family DNA-binding domain-containing protein [Lactiplantibacillus brownii]
MVYSRFEENPHIATDDPIVIVQAAAQDSQIQALMSYINRYQAANPTILPVKSEDRILMIRPGEIILADLVNGQLLLTTINEIVVTNEALSHFLGRLAKPSFVQVSKHAALNLDHLLSLSDSFSGSMSARLTNRTKTEVSRKYVKELLQRLEV